MCWTSVWTAMPGRSSEAWLGSRCPPCLYRKESGWDARRTTCTVRECAKRLDLQGKTCVITGATECVARVRQAAAANAPQALRPILTGRRRSRVWRRHDDVACKAGPLEQADQEPGDVELPP